MHTHYHLATFYKRCKPCLIIWWLKLFETVWKAAVQYFSKVPRSRSLSKAGKQISGRLACWSWVSGSLGSNGKRLNLLSRLVIVQCLQAASSVPVGIHASAPWHGNTEPLKSLRVVRLVQHTINWHVHYAVGTPGDAAGGRPDERVSPLGPAATEASSNLTWKGQNLKHKSQQFKLKKETTQEQTKGESKKTTSSTKIPFGASSSNKKLRKCVNPSSASTQGCLHMLVDQYYSGHSWRNKTNADLSRSHREAWSWRTCLVNVHLNCKKSKPTDRPRATWSTRKTKSQPWWQKPTLGKAAVGSLETGL